MDLFSDCDSIGESSGSEEQDDIELLYGGQASSILSSLEETIEKIDDLLSFERVFMHGDIICSITEPSGQMGRVVNIDMLVDLENLHGKIIKDVNSRNLKKIRTISVGDYVVHGPWVGKVDKIVDCVTILFDDGSKSSFTTVGPQKLIPISTDLLEDSQYPYYPGQRVRVELSSVSRSSRWLCDTWKGKRDEGTVCAIEAGLVYVDWLACALVGCEKMPPPSCLQDSNYLTLLSCFPHVNWQLGDWCMLPTLARKGSVGQPFVDASTFDPTGGHKQPKQIFQRITNPSIQEIFVIVKTKAKVDILWQDGNLSLGVDANSLFPVNIADAHDFWPEQFVLEKGSCDDPYVSSSQRWGIVRAVDAKERMVKVKWESFSANHANVFSEDQMEETVSAYELVEHPDYSYCHGDVVFQLVKDQKFDQVDEQISKNNTFERVEVGEEANLKGKKHIGEHNELPHSSYLSCIGIVLGFKDGSVKVKWANGCSTKVAPYEIFRMDKHEVSSPAHVLPGQNVEQVIQELPEHRNQSFQPKEKSLLDSVSHALPQAARGILSSIVGSLFGSLHSTSLSGTPGSCSELGHELVSNIEEEALEPFNLCMQEPQLVADDLQMFGERNLQQQIKDANDRKPLLFSSDSKKPESFKQFDMVDDCSDHHFFEGASKGLTTLQVKRCWLKKVQQEWSMLEKDLPEMIYVRVYEERMDLLRAAIIGAPGTPYHDGLFFFDIFLPPDYPHEPPLVHYISSGLRLNPNLYESGKVCLSLLNTWTGTGTEVWNPESSTLLQVLLSLQALVLNEKPYFNEAGYDKQMGRAKGEKNSASYNENAFLVSCKSMLHLLRKPPKHFEALVDEHFRNRSHHIMLACKAYMEGAPVGRAFGDKGGEQENQEGSSTGFKIMLSKLFPKLLEAFSEKGMDCRQFVDV